MVVFTLCMQIGQLRYVYISWDVQLAVFVSDKVPEIFMGDPGRFRQIITNLVGNSIKVSVIFMSYLPTHSYEI